MPLRSVGVQVGANRADTGADEVVDALKVLLR